MVRRPPGCLRINPAEPELRQIEPVDKGVDHAKLVRPKIVSEDVLQKAQKREL